MASTNENKIYNEYGSLMLFNKVQKKDIARSLVTLYASSGVLYVPNISCLCWKVIYARYLPVDCTKVTPK